MENPGKTYVISSASDLRQQIAIWKTNPSCTVGFVPTMGALHEGHLKLVEKAKQENDFVVVSIFVNPTQFNNAADLSLYPRTLENDLLLLSKIDSCVVFTPSIIDVYPKNDPYKPIHLQGLDATMEGEFRPGHFQGVVHVVHNLFNLVLPNKAYFGKKDFQQLAIIRFMNSCFHFPIELVACETIRETTGLAMSSRNVRLSDEEKKDALVIIDTLQLMKELKENGVSPTEAARKCTWFFNQSNLKLEYLTVVDSVTLKPLVTEWSAETTCCIAAHCGAVRLIDNLEL
jgi:pantoate--beta-alanine ligase